MASTDTTPFEHDIAEQPEALGRLAEASGPDLAAIVGRTWERVVLTGMGSSHFAALPTWRALVGLGVPAWAVDTSALLDTPGLLTPGTLVVATSQSGASGEIVELLDRRSGGEVVLDTLVGVADDGSSPLAGRSDVFLPLLSGSEATVSTKSYLNTLAVHAGLIAAFRGAPQDAVRRSIAETAESVARTIASVRLDEVAAAAATHLSRRLSYVARGDEASTALFAALITKESSKVPAEGFVGGEFRHGPFELAGQGHTAMVFTQRACDLGGNLHRLVEDLVQASSTVVLVGDDTVAGAVAVPGPGRSTLETLAVGAVVAELFAVRLARANGYVPGAFLHGSKVTTAL